MKKSHLFILSSIASISLAAGLVLISRGVNNSNNVLADSNENVGNYTITNWAYDGWCKNTYTGYQEYARAFMFHSTGEGVRNNVKLLVLLYQPQEDIEVSENLTYKVVNGMPSILTTSTYGWQEGFDPAWPEDSALSIYKVRFFIGDYDFTGNESEGRIENETPHTNFNNVTFSIGTTMTYSKPSDDQGGYYYRVDFEYNKTFTSNETIGYYPGDYPHTGIAINSVSVSYSCNY